MLAHLQAMEVRTEQPEDIAAIRAVILAAFGRSGEADLVDRLRGINSTFSFVAVESGQIVGHIFLSPVEIEGTCPKDLRLLGLAPVAVRPEYQRQGIGSQLIRHGLEVCDRAKIQAVFVLGWSDYYPRFGFTPAKNKGLGCEYPVPDERFMVLELEQGALADCTGTVKYRSEFNELE